MQTWSITLHGSSGVISTVDTSESQFVIGTETANDECVTNCLSLKVPSLMTNCL